MNITGTPGQAIDLEDATNSLLQSFGIAAALVLVGVAVVGGYLRFQSQDEVLTIPALPTLTRTAVQSPVESGNESWLARGDAAFTAGRMVEPVQDNALYYYGLARKVQPDSIPVQEAVTRLLTYLHSSADQALYRNDWEEASRYGHWMLTLSPGLIQGEELLSRVRRVERVESLTQQAVAQMTQSKFITPAGDNALSTYQRILRLDARNAIALQGIDTISQRLLASAQAAVFADDQKVAEYYLGQVRAINPTMPGLSDIAKLSKQRHEVSQNKEIQKMLVAAAKSMQEGLLISPENDGALSQFEAVLRIDPKSLAALQGKRLVANTLVGQARTHLATGDLDSALTTIQHAELAGGDESVLAEIREQVDYRQRLDASRVVVPASRLYAISELDVIRQVQPDYPRRVGTKKEGWAQVIFSVDIDGSVINAYIDGSSSPVFEEAALTAINRWRFKPVLQNEQPLIVQSGVRFTFRQ